MHNLQYKLPVLYCSKNAAISCKNNMNFVLFFEAISLNFYVPNVQASTPTGNIFGPITGRLFIFGPYEKGKERKGKDYKY